MSNREFNEANSSKLDYEAFKKMKAADRADYLAEHLEASLNGSYRPTDYYGEEDEMRSNEREDGKYEFYAGFLASHLFKNVPYRDHAVVSRALRRLADKGSDKLNGKVNKRYSKDSWSFESAEYLARKEAEELARKNAKATSKALVEKLGFEASVGRDGDVTFSAAEFAKLAALAMAA